MPLCAPCLQILLAVEHIHGAGVVHMDIKPANVFLTSNAGPDQRVKLGDFDVSRTNEERMTTIVSAGFTADYAAPEVKEGRLAGTAADMYSFGLMMLDLHLARRGKRRPPLLNAGTVAAALSAQVDEFDDIRAAVELIQRLTVADPGRRPRATDALAHGYFQDSARAVLAAQERKLGPMMTCGSCRDDVRKVHGIVCPQGRPEHFLCDCCFADFVESSSKPGEDSDLFKREARVACVFSKQPNGLCHGNTTPYAESDIAKHVPTAVFVAYRTARDECLRVVLQREKDAAVAKARQDAFEEFKRESEAERCVRELYTHISERVLSLRYACAARGLCGLGC
jgi:serine/threonine protein kinase